MSSGLWLCLPWPHLADSAGRSVHTPTSGGRPVGLPRGVQRPQKSQRQLSAGTQILSLSLGHVGASMHFARELPPEVGAASSRSSSLRASLCVRTCTAERTWRTALTNAGAQGAQADGAPGLGHVAGPKFILGEQGAPARSPVLWVCLPRPRVEVGPYRVSPSATAPCPLPMSSGSLLLSHGCGTSFSRHNETPSDAGTTFSAPLAAPRATQVAPHSGCSEHAAVVTGCRRVCLRPRLRVRWVNSQQRSRWVRRQPRCTFLHNPHTAAHVAAAAAPPPATHRVPSVLCSPALASVFCVRPSNAPPSFLTPCSWAGGFPVPRRSPWPLLHCVAS